MTGPRIARLSALASATATLVLGTPSPASAECAAPTYHGGLPLHVGECPEAVAGGASAGVWALLILAAGLWLAWALSRSRAATDADLATIDEVFSQAAAAEPTPPSASAPTSTPPSLEGGR
ncbi:hypothetical protein ABT121_16095 [Streptomyces sp. NPDC001928]|uniref:hypothetical protein n=1 Tax=Streptomyces sp. NPDC001928 TaxID=3154404 RepID=UPI0033181BCE